MIPVEGIPVCFLLLDTAIRCLKDLSVRFLKDPSVRCLKVPSVRCLKEQGYRKDEQGTSCAPGEAFQAVALALS